ncbi:MAG TPA: peptidoglycan-associated lipoprotein Pal [Geomonas sp.]|nr:peptidoglycan-associated lipoprotein Pal [Geomonas sp.]
MRKQIVALFFAVGCVGLAASGCAKHETVKAEEPVAPSATVAKPVKTEAAAPAATQAVAPEPVREQTASPRPEPVSEAAELKASLEKIYFDFDDSTLSKDARDRLTHNAEMMKKDSRVNVRIEGNCDERGSDEYNLALGEKRAQAAKKYLTSLGVPAERLSVISYGKEKPADPGHDAAAWAKNRRDEFTVSGK